MDSARGHLLLAIVVGAAATVVTHYTVEWLGLGRLGFYITLLIGMFAASFADPYRFGWTDEPYDS
jgi:hypothetical protein